MTAKQKQALKKQLVKESKLAHTTSMETLKEFEGLDLHLLDEN